MVVKLGYSTAEAEGAVVEFGVDGFGFGFGFRPIRRFDGWNS